MKEVSSMRKALCVGIDYYGPENSLSFCVSDAKSVAKALARHADRTVNFDILPLYGDAKRRAFHMGNDPLTGEPIYEKKVVGGTPIPGKLLKLAVEKLFDATMTLDVALFYFAGHGYVNANGGYLCASDGDDLPLDYVMSLASRSKAVHKIIILDSCHSGSAGKLDQAGEFCRLPNNTIVLASCTERGTAADGCFTQMMVDALMGGAMNLMGEVSPGGVYDYLDRALGGWDQRPVLKANIENFVCLRKNKPPIRITELRQITKIFPKPDQDKPLDPSYEEDKRDVTDEKYMKHNPKKERIFAILRKYASLNLVVPVDAPHMYQAAVNFKSCRLTPLGRYFWQLVHDDRI